MRGDHGQVGGLGRPRTGRPCGRRSGGRPRRWRRRARRPAAPPSSASAIWRRSASLMAPFYREVAGRSLSCMQFPERRMRRLRRTPALRRLVAETRLSVDDLIAPLFVREGIDEPQPISSLPGPGAAHPGEPPQGGGRAGRARHPGRHPLRHPGSTRTPRARRPGTPTASSSSPCGTCGTTSATTSSSSPTSASTSTPTTATAASSPPTAGWTTTPPSSATPWPPWPRPRPGPTSSPPPG